MDKYQTFGPRLWARFIDGLVLLPIGLADNCLFLAYFIRLVITNQYAADAHINPLLGRILTYAGLGWFLLEILTMFTNDKKRALHDYIAGTVVIRTD